MKLSYNPELMPGSWSRGETWDKKKTGIITCPICGGAFSLSNHTINEFGLVSPSVVCPYNCTFHEWIILDDWRING